MIDKTKLDEVLEDYKLSFQSTFSKEKFKWQAIKWFQEHWNIDAEDFKTMFETSVEKTDVLLTANQYFPAGMIKNFADVDSDYTRKMFINLYDESKDIVERINTFIASAEYMNDRYANGQKKSHFQSLHEVSIYLWLRYPDKYYIYKYGVAKNVSTYLSADYVPKMKKDGSQVVAMNKIYGEIHDEILKREDLKEMLFSSLDDTCYKDQNLITLTCDVCFFIGNHKKNEEDAWIAEDYDSGITVKDWELLLKDSSIFNQESLRVMKCIMDNGGQATCKELANKYGGKYVDYRNESINLAKRVASEKNVKLYDTNTDKNKYWPILYVGKQVTDGFLWKVREELSSALKNIDMTCVSNNSRADVDYWWLTANPKIWSFSQLAVGKEESYTLYNDNGHKRQIFANFNAVKLGDLVIGYEASPVKKIVALAEITKASDGKVIVFKKTEALVNPIEYKEIKEYKELENMEFIKRQNGSLFKMTHDEYDFILDRIRENNPVPSTKLQKVYTEEDFLNDVFLPKEKYLQLKSLIEHKKNVILQGAPGVGKTYSAKRLAYAMMGEENDERIEMIQFHQSYSYEDFVEGYRPNESEFALNKGVFYKFCEKARNYPDKKYFFLIDEINRGNLSKIFGELMMLIEKDYREKMQITLPYSGTSFSVPSNIYIIGMMNTADRSLAMIDYALRRRFSFFEMEPGFDTEGFKKYLQEINNEMFTSLIGMINELNTVIAKDPSLGRGFRIGHSYFSNKKKEEVTKTWMQEVIEYEIIPTLEEYWFDDETKLRDWKYKLHEVLDDER